MSDKKPEFANFFDLFEQPVSFDINVKALSTKLRELQNKYHPDRTNDSSGSASQQNSAVINHAYQILANPDSRANYLLELTGHEINTDHSIADLDFLDDAMDMRVALDEATDAADISAINTLKSNVTQRIDTHSKRFSTAYQSHDWQTAMDATQKLKFLVKLDKDMDAAIDESHQQSDDNDDDLYL